MHRPAEAALHARLHVEPLIRICPPQRRHAYQAWTSAEVAQDVGSINQLANAQKEYIKTFGDAVRSYNQALSHEPGHPAADADGYVMGPNVDPLLELMDMREAQRSFEANLNALGLARSMIQRTLDLLR